MKTKDLKKVREALQESDSWQDLRVRLLNLVDALLQEQESNERRYEVNSVEVSKEVYVQAERRNGFRNTLGYPNEPATSGWSNSSTGERGRIIYGSS